MDDFAERAHVGWVFNHPGFAGMGLTPPYKGSLLC